MPQSAPKEWAPPNFVFCGFWISAGWGAVRGHTGRPGEGLLLDFTTSLDKFGFRILEIRSPRALDSRSWVLDLDPGFWVLDFVFQRALA